MAKYQVKIELTPEAEDGPDIEPTLEEIARAVDRGVRDAFPEAKVRVYDENRPDRD